MNQNVYLDQKIPCGRTINRMINTKSKKPMELSMDKIKRNVENMKACFTPANKNTSKSHKAKKKKKK